MHQSYSEFMYFCVFTTTENTARNILLETLINKCWLLGYDSELAQTTLEPPTGGGGHGGERAPYGSERPIGVKGPHRSERSPCSKGAYRCKGAHRGEL